MVSNLTVRAHTQQWEAPDTAEAARGAGPQTPPRQRVGTPQLGPGDVVSKLHFTWPVLL